MVRTSPRDRLHARHASLEERGGIGSQDEACSSTRELGKTSDWQVLVVERRVIQEDIGSLDGVRWISSSRRIGMRRTHLLHDGQHPRLVIVIPVCPDTKVNLLRVCVLLVSTSELVDTASGQLASVYRYSLGVTTTPYGSAGARGTSSHFSVTV